jgi:hypothetical protein
MHTRTSLCAGLIALSSAAAAQQAAPEAPIAPPSPTPMWAPLAGLPGHPGEDMAIFVSSELGGRSIVKGAPYSATATSESRQTLADGNRLSRSSTMKIARDGQGRTRQEQASGVVFINDVVAGKRFALNTQNKTARELPMTRSFNVPVPPLPPVPPVPGSAPPPPKPPAPMSEDEARSWAESMRQWGREFAAKMRGDAVVVDRDVNVIVKRSEAAPGAPAEVSTERVEVIRFDGMPGDRPPMHFPLAPPIIPPEPGVTTSLGSRDFDGVRADGTKTTWTIAAGRIGNEKPIEIVSERWYSPELMIVVQSRHADPRSGERIYRLEGLKREEPSADLFKVPAGFETTSPSRSQRR